MPHITLYVVQTFVPFERQSAGEARLKAQLRAPPIKASVIAWAMSGDPDNGEWDDDPEILLKAGRTGD
jgi:hypothetical protein